MKGKHGWSSADLSVVSNEEGRYWSVAEASKLLGPPELTESQVRQLVRLANLIPVGKRFNGPRRRHVRVYDSNSLIEAFDSLASVMYRLTTKETNGETDHPGFPHSGENSP